MAHIKRRAPEKHTPNDNNTIPNTLVMTSVAVKRDLHTCKQTNTIKRDLFKKMKMKTYPKRKQHNANDPSDDEFGCQKRLTCVKTNLLKWKETCSTKSTYMKKT